MGNNKEVLNAREAADFLGAHVETVRRMARKGEIPAYKIGKDWRFRKKALINWGETNYLRRKPPCVLIIDDDAGVRKMMRSYLEADGYRTCLASDGAEGLACLNREHVDSILLDLKMQGMNGPAFLRDFRKQRWNLPVIVVTGYPDSDLVAEAIKYGPFTMLPKPFERAQLLEALHGTLNGARLK